MVFIKYVFFTLAVLFVHSGLANSSVFIKSVQIIDGNSNLPTEPLDIEIIDGVIYKIGSNLTTKLQNIIDGKGLFAMPGLIDCHTHLRSVPGSVFRKETLSEIKQQQLFQLKSYLASGVTTVLDAATPELLFEEINTIAKNNTIPRVLGLAPFLTPKNGYFSSEGERRESYQDLWEPVENSEQAKKHINASLPLNALGIKLTVENGLGPFKVWPHFDEAIKDTIIEAAKSNNLPLFIHSYSEKEFEEALKYSPYAFVHSGFNERLPSANILAKIKDSGAYVISTLAVYKLMLLMWDKKLFDELWFQRLVPKKQIESAKKYENSKKIIETMAQNNTYQWVPTFFSHWFADFFINENRIQNQLDQAKRSLFEMYRTGIPIVMGADAGNWPLFTTYFHGVGSILEMEALVSAGIPASEVIKSATVRAATLLKISDKVGTIEPGKLADILLLPNNPLENMKALREINWVIKSGLAKSPDDWLKN